MAFTFSRSGVPLRPMRTATYSLRTTSGGNGSRRRWSPPSCPASAWARRTGNGQAGAARRTSIRASGFLASRA